MTEETGFVSRPGIVDKVEAKRNSAGEVLRLQVVIRCETEFAQTYYAEQNYVDEVMLSLPVDSRVNPGDVASVVVAFKSPFSDRFQPALEVGNQDVLDVMVEDGMVNEAKEG